MENNNIIEELLLPTEHYQEQMTYKEMITLFENFDVDKTEAFVNNMTWNDEEISYELVKESLTLFLNSVREDKQFTIDQLSLTFDEDFIYNYSELAKYFLVLYGTYHESNPELVSKYIWILYTIALTITDDIVTSLEGYPEVSVNTHNWLSASVLVDWLDAVIGYYFKQEKNNSIFNIRLCQLKLIIAAKGHYPDEVSWAMMNLGLASENIGNKEGAIQCYEAIINDFGFVLEEELVHENEFLYEKVKQAKQLIYNLNPNHEFAEDYNNESTSI